MNKTNQTFDIARFGNCLKRDLMLNGRSWLLRGLMMLGVTTLLLIFATNIGMGAEYEKGIDMIHKGSCFVVMKFCGTVFCALGASLFMENMTSNGLRLNSLMSPASDLEKYLSRFLICIVGVTIAFVACFALADLLRVAYYHIQYPAETVHYFGPFAIQDLAENIFYFWIGLFAVQSTFVLGSTVWPKNSFLKTFGAIVVFMIVFIIVSNNVYGLFLEPGHCFTTESTITNVTDAMKVAVFVWIAFCYITAYFRFKESEIINRL